MRRLILDTSFLLAAVDKPGPVNLSSLKIEFPSAPLLIPEECYRELVALMGQERARNLVSSLRAEIVRVGVEPPDDAVLSLARDLPGAVIATLDMELKNRARTQGIPVVYLRSGKKLEVEGLPI